MGAGHGHPHAPPAWSSRPLLQALVLTLAFALVEAVGGWWSGSLALLGDAGHMVTDAVALGLAAAAAHFAQRPPSARHSYGFGRVEVLAALANGLFMLVIVVAIVTSAVGRLLEPRPVIGWATMAIAAVGLGVNGVVALMLSRGEQNLNIRGALLHVMGDMLGSIAALVAGAVVHFTGWMPIDPLLSLLICVLILISSFRLLAETLHILMEGVPRHLDWHEIGATMTAVPGVESVHDLHVWTLSSGRVALSAHVGIRRMDGWDEVLAATCETLDRRYGIRHVTLQPEPAERRVALPVKPPA